MARIQILSAEEQKVFSTPPIFSYVEKEYFFRIPNELQVFAKSLKDIKNRICFYLLYGYYKADSIFYSIDKFRDDDIEYIKDKLHSNLVIHSFKLSQRHIRRYKQIIKKHLSIRDYTSETRNILLKEATVLANNFTQRKKIFYELIALSKKLKIEVPVYSELSIIISSALNCQKQDILDKLAAFAKDEKLSTLDEFLQKDTASKNRWQLSHYKKLKHATNKKKMLANLSKFNTIKTKFDITQSIIETIGLTPKIVQYHARWIEKSQVFQVKCQTNTKFRQ